MLNSTETLSIYTQSLLSQGLILPDQIAKIPVIRACGALMLVTAIFGILVNIKVLLGYMSKKMSSFSIMCSSKTISNSIAISGYLLYNAPITILNNFERPTFLNKIVNQMVTFGVYPMGPLTQFLISVNRLLVFYFVKQSMAQNNQKFTFAILTIFWLISLNISVIGAIDDCNEVFIPELLNWYSGGCDFIIEQVVMWFVLFCAILSNLCNVLVLVQLMASIIRQRGRLDSISTARRKRRTRQLFIQNCIQDWLFVIDYTNAVYTNRLIKHLIFQFIFSVYSNLFTYVFDGFIMLVFEYESRKVGRRKPVVQVKMIVEESPSKQSEKVQRATSFSIELNGSDMSDSPTIMSLSNETLSQIWIEDTRPEDVAEPWMTISAGIFMVLISSFGITINLLVLRRFISKQMSSFYIMCSSKTVSNCIVLFCYLFFDGPVSIFRSYYGPDFLNMLLNQIAAYGVYVQGPMTQVCISFNRFLVIYFATMAKRKNGQGATLLALSVCWSISFLVTVAGIPGNCTNIYNFDILTWDNLDPCLDILADMVMYWIGFLAIISNTLNLVVAIKLVVSSTKTYMDSVASKRRRRTSRKLFLQSCFQDWIYLIDTLNSMYVYTWSDSILYQFFFTIFSNLFVHVADGCIMLLFNYEKKSTPLTTLQIMKREATINVTF